MTASDHGYLDTLASFDGQSLLPDFFLTSYFHGCMTSSEVLDSPSIETMPSASPVSDFPNSLMEREMLPLDHISVFKRQGSPDGNVFHPVSSSQFLIDVPKAANNNTQHIINERGHDTLATRTVYNPVQYLNAMTEHNLKGQFLTSPGLCQLMTEDRRDDFYISRNSTINNNNDNNDNASDINMRSNTTNNVDPDQVSGHNIRNNDVGGIPSTSTRTYSSICYSSSNTNLVSCHSMDNTKVYTNLDSHKTNLCASSINEDLSHQPRQQFPSSLSQSSPLTLSPPPASPSILSSTLLSPSSSPSCMYVSHLTSSPNHSQLPVTLALPESSRNVANQSTASCGSEAILSHSYIFSEANNNTASSQVPYVANTNSNEYPLENEDNFTSRLRKKRFHCEPGSRLLTDADASDDDDAHMTWTLRAPHYWTCGEVLDWLFHAAQEQGLDMQKLRAENFQGITGHQLCQMEREEFSHLEPTFGLVIYEMVEKMMSGDCFPKQEVSCCYTPSTPSPIYSQTGTIQYDTGRPISTSQSFHETTPLFADIKQEEPCIYQEEMRPPVQYFKQNHPQEHPDNSSINYNPYSFDMNDMSPSLPISQGLVYSNECCIYQGSFPASQVSSARPPYCYSAPPPPLPPAQLPRRKPGRPRVKNLIHAAKTGRDKKAKNQHLWEFIYEVLMNPLYNPKYLRWENQREGVFRFVQSEAVAQLWGGRKNNENMTYEKLSRAMRHYYRRGILERVEGRRLVYKFSLKAIDRMKIKKSNSQ